MVVEKSTNTMDEEKGRTSAEALGVNRICWWRRAAPKSRLPGAAICLEVRKITESLPSSLPYSHPRVIIRLELQFATNLKADVFD